MSGTRFESVPVYVFNSVCALCVSWLHWSVDCFGPFPRRKKKITQKKLVFNVSIALHCFVFFTLVLQSFLSPPQTQRQMIEGLVFIVYIWCVFIYEKKNQQLILPCILLLGRTWSPNNGTKWPNPFNCNVTNRIWEKWRIGVENFVAEFPNVTG